jgi:electron transport complex protein RnfC
MKSFAHGIHPSDHKETAVHAIRRFPFPASVTLPLNQHIGAPAKALVTPGMRVRRGQKVAEATGFVSVPYHAPVTGVVRVVGQVIGSHGRWTHGLIIETEPGDSQQVEVWQGPAVLETPQDVLLAVRETGMVGLGGAGFPTHVKYTVPAEKPIHTLIINGAECEPYLTCDHRAMLEWSADLFRGIGYLLKLFPGARVMIGVEANKSDAVKHLRSQVPEDMSVDVRAIKVKYPQGAEKMLIHALLGVDLPPGKLPLDLGVVVSNVATVAQLGNLLPQGGGLIERLVTVAGPGVEDPGNYLVPVGTSLRFVLETVGLKPDAKRVVLGGPMMGRSVANLDIPIAKGTSGVVVLTEADDDATIEPEQPCIRCGYCLQACPMFLNPQRLGQLAKLGQYQRMEQEQFLKSCFECGSCTYVCPARIPLVQRFRVAKAQLRRSGGKP